MRAQADGDQNRLHSRVLYILKTIFYILNKNKFYLLIILFLFYKEKLDC